MDTATALFPTPPPGPTGYKPKTGRPRRPDTTLPKTIGTQLNARERRLAERLAVHEGVSLAEILRLGIASLARERQIHEPGVTDAPTSTPEVNATA